MTPSLSVLVSGSLGGALWRYRLMAWAVGAMLLLLCVVAIPLQYAAGLPALATVVAPLHGFLYLIYLVTVADLARRARFGLGQILALVGAGFVPGLAFVVEHRTMQRMLNPDPAVLRAYYRADASAVANERPAASTADRKPTPR